jgi:hypothetical protein
MLFSIHEANLELIILVFVSGKPVWTDFTVMPYMWLCGCARNTPNGKEWDSRMDVEGR